MSDTTCDAAGCTAQAMTVTTAVGRSTAPKAWYACEQHSPRPMPLKHVGDDPRMGGYVPAHLVRLAEVEAERDKAVADLVGQKAAVLALVRSDEALRAITDGPCLEGPTSCYAHPRSAKHPECAHAALIAYLTADALTKEAP